MDRTSQDLIRILIHVPVSGTHSRMFVDTPILRFGEYVPVQLSHELAMQGQADAADAPK